jgi:hypothetical protein
MSKDMSDSTTAFPTGSSDSYREFPDYDTVEERERALRWAINRAREVWTILRPSTGYRDDPNIGEIYGPDVYLYIEGYEGGPRIRDCQSRAVHRARLRDPRCLGGGRGGSACSA